MCKGAHDGEAVAEDGAVCPIYVVLVKVNCLAIVLLRIGEEFTLDVLAFCDLQDGFGTDALVDVQCYRIDGEGFRLLFACPFQPGTVIVSECIGDGFRFLGVSACCCAFWSSSGSLSASPFGSNRRLGGRCGLYAYSCFGVSLILPCAAMPAGGLFFRVAVSCR